MSKRDDTGDAPVCKYVATVESVLRFNVASFSKVAEEDDAEEVGAATPCKPKCHEDDMENAGCVEGRVSVAAVGSSSACEMRGAGKGKTGRPILGRC